MNLKYFLIVFLQTCPIIYTFFLDLLNLVEPIDTIKWLCFLCRFCRCLKTNSSITIPSKLYCISCVFFFLLLLPLLCYLGYKFSSLTTLLKHMSCSFSSSPRKSSRKSIVFDANAPDSFFFVITHSSINTKTFGLNFLFIAGKTCSSWTK